MLKIVMDIFLEKIEAIVIFEQQDIWNFIDTRGLENLSRDDPGIGSVLPTDKKILQLYENTWRRYNAYIRRSCCSLKKFLGQY